MIWFYLTILGSGMYALLRCFSVSKYSAVFGGLTCSLTPYTFGLIGAGHLNKIFFDGLHTLDFSRIHTIN